MTTINSLPQPNKSSNVTWPKEIYRAGVIATLRTAKKRFDCHRCWKQGGEILPGEKYYSIFYCNAGVQAHPDRICLHCIEDFLKEEERKREEYRVSMGFALNSAVTGWQGVDRR